MNYKDLKKDDGIIQVIKHLRDKFGHQCFKINDYWDSDLLAIGLSDNFEKYLIYISTYNQKEGHYFISLENSSSSADFPYEQVGVFDEMALNELESIFKQHLRI